MEEFIYNEIIEGTDSATCPIESIPPEEDDSFSDDNEYPLYDQAEIDNNGDGQTDMIISQADTDGDGFIDTEVVIIDNNYDGVFESSVVDTDETGDGIIDTRKRELDTDGDGVIDYRETIVDTNRNGIFDEQDSYQISMDSNKSGLVDTYMTQLDTNGDGLIDYAEQGRDYNNDGTFDSLKLFEDTTGNGKLDTMTELYDSDGNGKLDMAEIHYDYDGDGREDWAQICRYDPESGTVVPLNDMPEYGDISATYIHELPNYEPNENYPEGISGDPSSSMSHWEFQGQTNRCALYSQMFIVEEFTGKDIDIEEFTKIAEDNGWFNDGTTFLNTNKMLDYYGIENKMSFHNDISDIENCLNSGGRVIVGIDANEIWYGEGGDLFSPNAAANHAVEVIGIDYTNPNQPMVILNDSGNPNGRGVMVPLEDFMDAWKDGECQMIECYPNK